MIIGPDMQWDGDEWTPAREESADPVVRRARDFDTLVRHVYKVLLTRGLRGCGIYVMDETAAKLLAGLVPDHV